MPNMITNGLRIENAEAFAKKILSEKTYIAIGKTTPWQDENNPICSTLDDKFIAETLKDIIGFKSLQQNSLVYYTTRIDWTQNTVFDAYDDNINMVDSRKSDGSPYKFYVLTSENNVYKCIGNANGKPSTVMPTDKSVKFLNTSDGYVWKYMYSISDADVSRYLIPGYMPIYTKTYNDNSDQYNVQITAEPGSIQFISVDDGGTDYIASNPPEIVISGDGSGAKAEVQIDSSTKKITNVKITNPGSGYTKAEITINGSNTSAKLRPIIGPITGHGKNAKLELGGTYLGIVIEINADESGKIPLGIGYRQISLVKDLKTKEKGKAIRISESDCLSYKIGDIVKGLTSNATATVVAKDDRNGLIYFETVFGDFTKNERVRNNTTKMESTIDRLFQSITLPAYKLVYNSSEVDVNSCVPLYIVNRTKIDRASLQKETLFLIVSF